MRIKKGENPLDESAVHPEAYPLVETMAKDLQRSVGELVGNENLIQLIDPKKYITDTFGEHTIKDVLSELKKPGLDPRSEIEQFEYANIYKIEDVSIGMIVPGIVTNITRFGVFIDIGVKQDGLVHVSELANRYITDPNEVVKLNDKVKVKVMEVDIQRKRIGLSIRQADENRVPAGNNKKERDRARTEKKPAQDLSNMAMGDALSLLKKKFGK
jgi:uncharacterized protein